MSNRTQDHEEFDVIVVGAGISGMTAAHRLKENGLRALVLEGKDRVGGRTWSEPAEGGPIDFGGMFIGETHHRSMQLGEELGLEKVPARPSGDMAWIIDGDLIRAGDGGYPSVKTTIGSSLETALTDAFGKVDALAQRVGSTAPWSSDLAPELDSMTVATWIAHNIDDPLVRRVQETDLSIVIGADPSEVSMLYWVSDVAKCENIHALQVTANHSLWIGGAQEISNRIAEHIGEDLRLGSPVTRIQQHHDHVVVSTDAESFAAKRVILATPPSSADHIAFEPALPRARRQLQGRATLGRYAKIQMRFTGRPWLDAGWSGEIFDLDRGSTTLDVTRPGDQYSTLVTFIGGSFCDTWADQDEAQRRQAMVDGVVAAFGPAVADPIGYYETIWTDQPHTMGGPVTVMPPGLLTTAGESIASPTGLIHMAGTEAATAWTGYMEGGVLAGEAAATSVAATLNAASIPA
jgi:monoamine oxidase